MSFVEYYISPTCINSIIPEKNTIANNMSLILPYLWMIFFFQAILITSESLGGAAASCFLWGYVLAFDRLRIPRPLPSLNRIKSCYNAKLHPFLIVFLTVSSSGVYVRKGDSK